MAWVKGGSEVGAPTPRFGQHLESARLTAGLSRADLATRLGVSEESVRRWERGWSAPSSDRIAQLIAVLSIDASALMTLPIHPDDLPPLARRLRDERAHRKITQAEAGELLGVAQPTYAGWEIGRAAPLERYYAVVAEFLGSTVSDVGGLVETPFTVEYAMWPAFGQLMGRRRQAMRLTRDELARNVGVVPGTIAAWELGYRTPRAQQVRSLSVALEISVAELQAALPRRELSALGDLIRSRQQQLGLPQRAIAERAGLDEATLSRWVQGHNIPKASSLRRLADALEVSFQEVSQTIGTVSP
jgi:transcriptional regulator with XRE-family HTH domain